MGARLAATRDALSARGPASVEAALATRLPMLIWGAARRELVPLRLISEPSTPIEPLIVMSTPSSSRLVPLNARLAKPPDENDDGRTSSGATVLKAGSIS